MKLAKAFENSGLDEIKAALEGGVLKLYTVARPSSPDVPVTRCDLVAVFKFASPAFAGEEAQFESNPVVAGHSGTPGFACAFKADGVTPIAGLSAGPGKTGIKLAEVTATAEFDDFIPQAGACVLAAAENARRLSPAAEICV